MKTNKTSPHVPIKLHAQHPDHIQVISSHLQDSVVAASSFAHDTDQHTFKLLSNRFCWENFLNSTNSVKSRVHCGIHFDHVLSVRKKNIHPHHPEKFYNLLSLHATENEVTLHFSGQSEICIEVKEISCKMADLHEPYPTQFLPTHQG
jgi:hypothetical protein